MFRLSPIFGVSVGHGPLIRPIFPSVAFMALCIWSMQADNFKLNLFEQEDMMGAGGKAGVPSLTFNEVCVCVCVCVCVLL